MSIKLEDEEGEGRGGGLASALGGVGVGVEEMDKCGDDDKVWVLQLIRESQRGSGATVKDFHRYLCRLRREEGGDFKCLVASLLSVQCLDKVALKACESLVKGLEVRSSPLLVQCLCCGQTPRAGRRWLISVRPSPCTLSARPHAVSAGQGRAPCLRR